MPTRIDYRHAYPSPVATAYATLVDRAFLEARLAEIGGPDARIVEHRVDDAGAAYCLRHAIDMSMLPAALRGFLAGNLVVERTETWTPSADGGHAGTVAVGVVGSPVPASATGEVGLAATGDAACAFTLGADLTVSVPLLGPRIEEFVAGQIRTLLDMEAGFTDRWLTEHS